MKSLTRYLGFALVRNSVVMALVFLSLACFVPDRIEPVDPAGYPNSIIAKHDCWRNDGQPHPIPGHAVVHMNDELVARYVGPRLTEIALHGNLNGEVLAFCK